MEPQNHDLRNYRRVVYDAGLDEALRGSPMIRRAALAAFTAALAMPIAAMATTQYATQMMQRWSVSDRCAANAQKAFPDYSPEGIAKREQAMQQCLSGNMLPPRQPQTPGSPPH